MNKVTYDTKTVQVKLSDDGNQIIIIENAYDGDASEDSLIYSKSVSISRGRGSVDFLISQLNELKD